MTIDRSASAYYDRAQELPSQIVAWRRHLHQHPELGFRFVLDESVFPVGAALLAASAVRLLRHYAG